MGIPNVFGEFYSKLYAEEKDDIEQYAHCRAEENKRLRGQKSEDKKNMKFRSSQKRRCRLQSTASKKGKAVDNNGIRAENIKACS